jgi:hypothetical protein
MLSKIAERKRRERIAASRRMTPAQRLKAFADHSALVAELHQAGARYRRNSRRGRRAAG